MPSPLSMLKVPNRAFSLTWPAAMLIYWNKRKYLHEKNVQLPEDFVGTPTWPSFHCFGTPIWPPSRHVKTLHIWAQERKGAREGNTREWRDTRVSLARPVLSLAHYFQAPATLPHDDSEFLLC